MGFSKPQQGLYRPLVKLAWEQHAKEDGLDVGDKAAHKAWYRAELLAAIGVESTADCNKTRHFDVLMAHFEAIARNDIQWTFAAAQSDTKRLLFLISKFCERNNITDAYARATAAKILKWPRRLDSLSEITNERDLQRVRVALIMHAKRLKKKQESNAPSVAELERAAVRKPRPPGHSSANRAESAERIDPDMCPF